MNIIFLSQLPTIEREFFFADAARFHINTDKENDSERLPVVSFV